MASNIQRRKFLATLLGGAAAWPLAARAQQPKVLLLPALSSISTRREMRPLQERLARRYSTLSVDWPGFGEGPRPQLDWTPDAYAAFLAFLLTSVIAQPHAVIAAGHAATYVLKHAATASGPTTRLVLIAPTWRGPLPTMAGGARREPASPRCASSPAVSIRSQAARRFSIWRGALRLRSSWSTATRRRRSRARKWRRLPRSAAFAPRGSPRANLPCRRSFPTRPSTPSSRSSRRKPLPRLDRVPRLRACSFVQKDNEAAHSVPCEGQRATQILRHPRA